MIESKILEVTLSQGALGRLFRILPWSLRQSAATTGKTRFNAQLGLTFVATAAWHVFPGGARHGFELGAAAGGGGE